MEFGVWFNKIFTFLIIAFWLGIVIYSIRQKLRIREKSEKLEFEAELGRSSNQLFHDISGHLSSLSFSLFNLENEVNGSEKGREYLENVNNHLEFLMEYTKDIKHLVKDVYDKSSRNMNLVEVINRVISSQVHACYAKLKIEVKADLPEEDILVPSTGFYALFNVVRNACQAMEQSEKRILQIIINKKADMVEIIISDTGVGIPEKLQSKIFDYGFTTKKEGSGQGMSIAKKAVENIGGQISVSSRENEGTEVLITLPFVNNT